MNLKETKRPSIYTAFKYWGKKPHNIWSDYIKKNTSSGFYFDPFSGSMISALEAYKLRKKAIAFDINPLSSFLLEFITTKYEKDNLIDKVNEIYRYILNDKIFNDLFKVEENVYLQNAKWNKNLIYEIGVLNIEKDEKSIKNITEKDYNHLKFTNIPEKLWYPKENFPNTDSFSETFKNEIINFSGLWTKRNLYVLSLIFDFIKKEKRINIKKQLLFGFLQTVHLSTVMCVPRSRESKRDFSTSWGRSAYFYPRKRMEMNPLFLFYNNFRGKQSVTSVLENAPLYLGGIPEIFKVTKANQIVLNSRIDIYYGIIDSKNLNKYVPEESVDFVLTDPPYGGLIKYLDLSKVWLVWLENFSSRYKTNEKDEITVNKDKNLNKFKDDLKKVFVSLQKTVKSKSIIIITFNSKDINTWLSLLQSILESGLSIYDIDLQLNKRTGDSNLLNKNKTSDRDYYLFCNSIKLKEVQNLDDKLIKRFTKRKDINSFKKFIIFIIKNKKFNEKSLNILHKHFGNIKNKRIKK
jgi:hypothetical protein